MKRSRSKMVIGALVLAIGLSAANATMAESDVTVRIIHTDTGEECTPEEEAFRTPQENNNQGSDGGQGQDSFSAASPSPFPDSAAEVSQPLSPSTGVITPAGGSPYPCTHENCYWSTPMDITDEERVWAMLMAPITVLDLDQKKQVALRKAPSEDAEAVADVTGYSQGVHVLETLDNGWSLVEVYSSSFHDSTIKAWNQFTQGYVQTRMLQVKKTGNTELAMVMDKLTQRVYLFKTESCIHNCWLPPAYRTSGSPITKLALGNSCWSVR